jgi:tetratricopeptide (TPR) repeat protein
MPLTSLLSYELLRRTATGYYAFAHHIIGGALAAPLLAKAWQDHTASLKDPLSDDAWIFAGPFVETAQRVNFLDAIFDVDIQLGARVASEIPELWKHAQEALDRCIAPDSAEVLRIHGIFALGHLGGTQSIAKLRTMKTRPGESLTHPMNMALAFAGDEDYLRTLLPEVDAHRSSVVTVTGGVMPIWDSAPIPFRLDLARRRLKECTPGSPVGESLRLVAFERDTSDVALIESHLHGARDIVAWHAALAALQAVDPARAKAAADAALSAPAATATDKARILWVAAGAGIDVNIHEAFRCATAVVPGENTEDLYRLIYDVIRRLSLPPDLVRALEEELPRSSGDRRRRLWQLASECHSEAIADYAASRLEAWDDDALAAYSYFIAQPDLARSRQAKLIEACEKALDVPFSATNWTLLTVLELLEQLGFTGKAVAVLSAAVERLVRVDQAARRNELDTLSAEDLAVFGNGQRDAPSIQLSMQASLLVPMVAQLRKRLPANMPLLLLHFDFTSSSVAGEMKAALSGHTDEAIDEVLQQIADLRVTVSGLSIVCPRGATEVRTRLLETALRQYHGHPAAMHTLTRTVEACWCEAVLEMVLRTVAQIPQWTVSEAQFFSEFTRMVAQRIQPENGPAIERAIADAQTGPAQRILNVWQTEALGRRIGLGTALPPNATDAR